MTSFEAALAEATSQKQSAHAMVRLIELSTNLVGLIYIHEDEVPDEVLSAADDWLHYLEEVADH